MSGARSGTCETGEFCYYYNSGNTGSISDFTDSEGDYGAAQPFFYPSPYTDRNMGVEMNKKVDVYLEFKNDKQFGLGVPLADVLLQPEVVPQADLAQRADATGPAERVVPREGVALHRGLVVEPRVPAEQLVGGLAGQRHGDAVAHRAAQQVQRVLHVAGGDRQVLRQQGGLAHRRVEDVAVVQQHHDVLGADVLGHRGRERRVGVLPLHVGLEPLGVPHEVDRESGQRVGHPGGAPGPRGQGGVAALGLPRLEHPLHRQGDRGGRGVPGLRHVAGHRHVRGQLERLDHRVDDAHVGLVRDEDVEVLGVAGDAGVVGDGVPPADHAGDVGPIQEGEGPMSAEELDRMTKLAQCLRRHGLDVKDPKPGQPFTIKSQKASGAKTEKAMKTCNADQKAKTLKGDARKAFMKECLSA